MYCNIFKNAFKASVNFQRLQLQTHKNLGIIYLNSPKDLNSMSNQMINELIQALKLQSQDQEIKTIILLSKVPKAFCSGGNIKQFHNKVSKDYLCNDFLIDLQNQIKSIQIPIICGVNGIAFGGGTQMALFCDIVVASDQARFCLPEIKLGLIPGFGGTQNFCRIMGRINAMRNILIGEIISAQKAEKLGIISEIYPSSLLHSKTLELGLQISKNSTNSLINAKKAINKADQIDLQEGLRYQRSLIYPLFDEPQCQQKINQFLAKKKSKPT